MPGRKLKTLLAVAAFAVLASLGCTPSSTVVELPAIESPTDHPGASQLKERIKFEQAIDRSIDPFLIKPRGPKLTLVALNETPFGDAKFSDEEIEKAPEVSFNRPDNSEVLDAIRQLRGEVASVKADTGRIKMDTGQIITDVSNVESAVHDEAKGIRDDIAELRKLIVEYQTDQGEVKTSAVPINPSGEGEIDLPYGAIITSIGGVPVGGESLTETFSEPSDECYTDPVTGTTVCPMTRVTVTDTPFATTRSYNSPGQFRATSTQTSSGNRFRVRVQSGPTGPVRRVLGRLFGG